ncbi:MAG: M48 family metallopeptidase [Gammaproteobacteria bacterium]|nr:M48 family metallopeptidase [Gammaproteobacteria bacterium]MDX2462188.1 M48 family metallopeptidase [Gammaproteobacteria bacterium]
MNTFTVIFLIALAAGTLLKWWLARRQLDCVSGHRNAVPEAFRESIDLKTHQRAADYTVTRTRAGMLEGGVAALLLLGWTLGGGIDLLNGVWADTGLSPLLSGAGLLLSTFLIMGLLEMPFDIYRTFVIEERFGFNRTTPRLFISDAVKQTLLLLAIGTPIILAVLWLMAHAGAYWWFYVWVVWMGFSLLLTWAYPALIAPLFNKFVPLDDGALKTRIESLLARNGFASKGIFVVDGSKRSGHGNAYFTGLGSNKRIVFFDTLLRQLDAEEVEAVLAHEVGHFKRKHIAKRIALMAIISLAGLMLLGWLIDTTWFYSGLGVAQPSLAVALLLFLFVVPTFTVFLQPLMSGLSRRHEFEADEFAAGQADAGKLIGALVKLYKENANTLTPDPLYSAFHDSHPPAPVRIANLQAKQAPAG